MKVEFCKNVLKHFVLAVTPSEFLKAKESTTEFESLKFALDSYCQNFCFNYTISKKYYLDIANLVADEETIIFDAGYTENYKQGFPDYYIDVYLKRNRSLLKIIKME